MPRTSSPKPMFSATVISGKRARFWKISAVGRLFGPMPPISLPPIRMTPDVGSMKPEIMRRIVVLPQPDGPRKLKNSPAGMGRCTSETAVNALKRMVTWSSSMSWLMKPRSKGAIPRRGSSTRDGAGPSRRQEAVLVFVADRDVPRFLDRPPPQLIQRVGWIGLGEELLVEVAQMSFRPLGRGVDAGVVGVECTRLRRIVPVDPFIGLGEVLGALGDAEAFHPGESAFLGSHEADGQVFLAQGRGGTVPGLADDAAIGAESALGLVFVGPELADRRLVVGSHLDDGVEVGAGLLLVSELFFDGVGQLALALQPKGDADQAGMAANGDPALVFRLPQVAVAGLAVFQFDDGAVEGDRFSAPVAGRQIALARHDAAHAGGTLDGAVDAAVKFHLGLVERLDQIEFHVVGHAINRRHDDVEAGTARSAELVQQFVIGTVLGRGRLDAGLLLEIGEHLGRDIARP